MESHKTTVPRVKYWTGRSIPVVGLGTYQITGSDCIKAVKEIIQAGYRHIDTASLYGNEVEIGKAIKQCGVDRKELYIVSKVWTSEMGYEKAIAAVKSILQRLQLDYLDLLLIHWPYSTEYPKDSPKQASCRAQTWRAFQKLRDEGKVVDIGVSNFLKKHLEHLIANTGQKPVINQFQLHPYLWPDDPIDYCRTHGIVVESYSSLMRGRSADIGSQKLLLELADKYKKKWSQIVLRWLVQQDIVVIPKARSPENYTANLELFDFSLTEEEMKKIKELNRYYRITADPHDITY